MHRVSLASLFDGIGGAPLCASVCGAEAVWASEIEKFPIKVTELRFPGMKHYGDITKINGAEVEPVDIIVGGSPCQDLSIAGKRAGLAGGRSGLFMEQIRIVKEMRDATNGTQPRYLVWENVPGAFSSNGGEDFRAVLEEVCRVSDPKVSVPQPAGRWQPSGSVLGAGWSVSWRTIDAQYFGVAQRRRRIYLVADLGGSSAPEILFEREGVCGDPAESGEAREGFAGATAEGVGGSGGCLTPWDIQSSANHQARLVMHDPIVLDMTHAADVIREYKDGVPTLQSRMGTGPLIQNERTGALCTSFMPTLFEPRSQDGHARVHESGICPSLNTAQGGQRQPCVVTHQEIVGTLSQGAHPGSYNGQDAYNDMFITNNNTVRRLTPLECERLQGYPDGWTDIPNASDSARYKALGNSFAVPCALFVIEGCVERISK